MPDGFADSTALLEKLVREVMKETDPAKVDQLAAEIWRVISERDRLRSAEELDQEPRRFET